MGSFHLRHGRGVHSLQSGQAPPPRKHPVAPHPATAAGQREGQKGVGSRRRGLTRWTSQLCGLAGHVAGGQFCHRVRGTATKDTLAAGAKPVNAEHRSHRRWPGPPHIHPRRPQLILSSPKTTPSRLQTPRTPTRCTDVEKTRHGRPAEAKGPTPLGHDDLGRPSSPQSPAEAAAGDEGRDPRNPRPSTQESPAGQPRRHQQAATRPTRQATTPGGHEDEVSSGGHGSEEGAPEGQQTACRAVVPPPGWTSDSTDTRQTAYTSAPAESSDSAPASSSAGPVDAALQQQIKRKQLELQKAKLEMDLLELQMQQSEGHGGLTVISTCVFGF